MNKDLKPYVDVGSLEPTQLNKLAEGGAPSVALLKNVIPSCPSKVLGLQLLSKILFF